MKIGPIDVRIPLLLYLVALVVLAVIVFKLWTSRASQRAEGYYAARINAAHIEGSAKALQDGAEFCRIVLAESPRCVPAMLHLATFGYKAAEYDKARGDFEKVAQLEYATPEQSAMGWVGAAACAFASYGAKERSKGVLAAKELLEKALKAKPHFPDAQAALAVIRVLEGAPEAAIKLSDEVLMGEHPPGLAGSIALHEARGAAHSRLGRAVEADRDYQAAMALAPQAEGPRNNRAIAVLSGLGLPGMAPADREDLIARYGKDLKVFGKNGHIARNCIAVGLWHLRKDVKTSVYLDEKLPRALKLLSEAIVLDKDYAPSYLNTLGLYENRLFGEPAEGGAGGMLATLPPELLAGRPMPVEKLSADTRKLCIEINRLAETTAKTWEHYLNTVKPRDAERTEAHLHLFGLSYLREHVSQHAGERAKLAEEQERLAQTMLQDAPQNPDVLQAVGLMHARRGSLREALELLRQARAAGAESPALAEVIEKLTRKPEFFGARPQLGLRAGSGVPLAAVSVRVRSGPGPLEATVTVNGKKAESVVHGTQVLLVPYNQQFGDGEHKIEFKVTDAIGNESTTVVKVMVDKRAPTWQLDPPDTQSQPPPRPVWTVHLTDVGIGVDLETVKVQFNSMGGTATPSHDTLVENGVFLRDMPEAGAKEGERIPGASFKIAPLRDVTPGAYQLKVTFADKAGNPGSDQMKALKVE